jgi:hypothetical protein
LSASALKRWQFGLPAVFGLMTLVALTLAWRARQIDNLRSAVAAVHAIRGAVFYHPESRGLRGDWERAWFDGQRRVEYITLRFSQPMFREPERFAEIQPHLKRLSSLRRLKLTGTSIGDEQLPLLMQLRQLELIDLSDTLVTPEGIKRLKQELPGCQIIN